MWKIYVFTLENGATKIKSGSEALPPLVAGAQKMSSIHFQLARW
jgi:hypothetical protein